MKDRKKYYIIKNLFKKYSKNYYIYVKDINLKEKNVNIFLYHSKRIKNHLKII